MSDSLALRLLDILSAGARACGDEGEDAALRLADRLGIGRFVRLRKSRNPVNGGPDGERVLFGLAQGFLREAAEELSAALTGRGVEHFFVKGVALADRLYEPGEREMADIDVHVDPSVKAAALAALEELGYHIPPQRDQSGPAALRSGLFAGRYTGSSHLEHIALDVAWGLDPVDRLLPRADEYVPREVWDRLDTSGALPVPADSHHVALLVHHLVHHDMLHFRGLVDLAMLWPRVPEESAPEIESLAKRIGVSRATRLLASVLRADLGLDLAPTAAVPDDRRGRRARSMLSPVEWCIWASQADDAEFVEINARRMRRRLLLLDRIVDARGLFADAIVPPREYLRWRWPEARSTFGAWRMHVMRNLRKLT